MRYPIAIEPGSSKTAFGVVVPDLPGCFSAGDTIEEAIGNAEDAILLWIEDALESDKEIPAAAPIDEHQSDPDYKGWIWALVSVDASKVMGPAERINITVPVHALAKIDKAAGRAGETRSAFLVGSALKAAAASKALSGSYVKRRGKTGRVTDVVKAREPVVAYKVKGSKGMEGARKKPKKPK